MNPELDQSECSLCLGPYNTPKLLDCHHTFCLKCLEAFIEHNSAKCMIKCPLCSHRSKIPEGGPSNYTTNFYIVKPENEVMKTYCQNHSTLEADSYCKDCNKAVCSKCILRNHRSHSFIDLECEETKSDILDKFSTMRKNMEKKMGDMQIFRTTVMDKSVELDDFASQAVIDVQKHVQNLCDIIKNMGATVVQEIENNVDENQKRLNKLLLHMDKVNAEIAEKLAELIQCNKTHTTAKLLETIFKLEKFQAKNQICKTAIPDITCLSFAESKPNITMDTLGCLITVQSPIMVSEFKDLISEDLIISTYDSVKIEEKESRSLIDLDEPINSNTCITKSTESYHASFNDRADKFKEPQTFDVELEEGTGIKTSVERPEDLTEKLPIKCYTELEVDINDLGPSNHYPVLSGVIWSVSCKRLGNGDLHIYLNLPIEGNAKINFCDINCQLTFINTENNLSVTHTVENQQLTCGEDCGIGVEIDQDKLTNPNKGFEDNTHITLGINLTYNKIVHY